MIIEKYVDKVLFKEYDEISKLDMREIMKFLKESESYYFYITKNYYPIYILESTDFIDMFLENRLNQNLDEYITSTPKKIQTLNYDTNLIGAYYFMRKNNLKKAAVIKDNKLIGEISFKFISEKLTDIIIKDPLTDAFNETFFQTLINNYKDFNKPIGIIYIDLKNMEIIEEIYGEKEIEKILKNVTQSIKSLIRDIDFIFRNNYRFKILTFNDLVVIEKIVKRIKNKLNKIEIDGIKINYSIAFSHVPELEESILLAINDIETKLID